MKEQSLPFPAGSVPRMPIRVELPLGGTVEYTQGYVAAPEAEALHAALVAELIWERRSVVLFGKRIEQPRLIAWAGALPYRYSGQTLPPRAAPPALSGIVARVSATTGVPFNHVLVNRYRDGNDGMGMHADAEPELGLSPTVASLSFGMGRRFVLAPRARGERFAFVLGQGDLLVMGGACQVHYRHGIPRAAGIADERVSVTLRHVLREPSD
jgi:alkylated DNA repair dioxygenase AlkB